MNLLERQRIIGIITIISGVLAFLCILATMISINFNNEVMADPLLVLSNPGTSASAVKWAMIFDMFGYYLLLLPAVYLLHDWMRNKNAWTNVITFSGLAYVLIGSIGAAILAAAWPRIITEFPAAGETGQQILRANFSLVNDIVYNGMWNLLEMVFAAIWWMSTGYILLKYRARSIGWLTIATGISCLGDATAGIFQLSLLHEISLNIYMVLAITWAIVIGVFFMKKRLSNDQRSISPSL